MYKENDIKFCREPMNRIGINNFRSEKRYFEMICHKVDDAMDIIKIFIKRSEFL